MPTQKVWTIVQTFCYLWAFLRRKRS